MPNNNKKIHNIIVHTAPKKNRHRHTVKLLYNTKKKFGEDQNIFSSEPKKKPRVQFGEARGTRRDSIKKVKNRANKKEEENSLFCK